jgi:hypothetical protein
MALTPVQTAAAAYIGGFMGDDVAAAVQLAMTVSQLDPNKAVNDHYGLWQIKKGAHPGLFKDYKWNNPADNARMANILWQRRANLIHSAGQWSTKDWPVLGTPAHVRNKLVADTAWRELQQRMKNGASPEKVLGASLSSGSKTPEGGAAAGPINAVTGATDPQAASIGDSVGGYVNQALGQFYKMGISTGVFVGAALLVVLGVVILLRQPLVKAAKTAAKAAV